ncbi:MAG: HD domain-containing protein [Synechococcales bacterium]|nr:HD domain-containing protein [Synechococcales bacterium]
MQPSSSRTYHDPLHGAITLSRLDPVEDLLIHLIDTPAFQRLRRIRQLGPASLTFHGAESSRFTHSLGVMAIARRAFDQLAHTHPILKPHRAIVLCGALLHDIGHGPFSHTCETVFGCHHEHWTMRILEESAPVAALLNQYSDRLLPDLLCVYRKQHPVPLVWQLVSSQLDCDRLDYLMRDSYFTGAPYGKLDLDRILAALRYDPPTQQLVVAEKGLAAIEHYLIVRYFMYAQVYNHPKNLAATWLLEQAFQRAGQLLQQGKISADDTLTAWLQQNCNELPLHQYLGADDGVLTYHLQRWQESADPILADLCRRFLDRDLLKALDVTDLSQEARTHLLHTTRSQLAETNTLAATAVDVYVGLKRTRSSGYTLYQRGIKLHTQDGLHEISERSPLIKTLIQPYERHWLLHPRSVTPQPSPAKTQNHV